MLLSQTIKPFVAQLGRYNCLLEEHLVKLSQKETCSGNEYLFIHRLLMLRSFLLHIICPSTHLISVISITSYSDFSFYLLVFQLRLTVAEAVGSMCHLMASDKLEEQIPRLVPAILSLYKKNNEHYIISKVGTV